MSKRKSRNPLAFWTDVARTAAATAVTLSVRVPQLAAGRMTAAERHRMVSKKLAAAGKGAVAGAAATTRVMLRRAVRPKPLSAIADLSEIFEAASRPARRRVKANATRLTKG